MSGGLESQELLLKAQELGAEGILEKPFSLPQFKYLLNFLLYSKLSRN